MDATGAVPGRRVRTEELVVRCAGCGRRGRFSGFDRATLGQSIADAGWVVATVKGQVEGWCKACADGRPAQFAHVNDGW